MMRILLVGASGLVGHHVFRLLQKHKDVEVIGTCFQHAWDEKLISVDLTLSGGIDRLLVSHQPDLVLWCAMHEQGSLEEKMFEYGLQPLLAHAKSSMRMLYVSTDGVFPGTKGNYAEDEETSRLLATTPVTAYTNTKRQTERHLLMNHENLCIVRVGPIYGQNTRGQWDRRTTSLILSLKHSEPLFRATNLLRTFVYVEDVANALVELAESSYRGILHLGPSTSSSYYDFALRMAKHVGLSTDLIQPYEVSPQDMEQKAIRVNTTLNTQKARLILQTNFRALEQL